MRASIYTTEDCILAERNLADYVLMYFLIYSLVLRVKSLSWLGIKRRGLDIE